MLGKLFNRSSTKTTTTFHKPTSVIVEEITEVETIPEEYMMYGIVAGIISTKLANLERLVIRDRQTVCSVLLDDNNRKPLVKLYSTNGDTYSVGTFDEHGAEQKHTYNSILEITALRVKILATLNRYESA